MQKRGLAVAAAVLFAAGAAMAAAPSAEILIPTVGLPLDQSSRTTIRFIVRNIGQNPSSVAAPFSGQTRLIVTHPDGQKAVYAQRAGGGGSDRLKPGHSKAWDVDLSKWLAFEKPGQYMIWFSVNGNESNRIILIKD